MGDLTQQHGARIRQLHAEAQSLADQAVDKARECGRLLTEVKTELDHGDFGKWITENCGFTDRTARRYMAAYATRDALPKTKTDTLSDIEPITTQQARAMAASRSQKAIAAGSWLLNITRDAAGARHADEVVDPDNINLDGIAPEIVARALIDLDEAVKMARANLSSYNKIRTAMVARLNAEVSDADA